jgi:hypothetical protein
MTDICCRKNEGGRSGEGGLLAAPVRPPLSDLRPQLCREELHRFILREEGADRKIFTDHNPGLFYGGSPRILNYGSFPGYQGLYY